MFLFFWEGWIDRKFCRILEQGFYYEVLYYLVMKNQLSIFFQLQEQEYLFFLGERCRVIVWCWGLISF